MTISLLILRFMKIFHILMPQRQLCELLYDPHFADDGTDSLPETPELVSGI